MLCPWLMDWRNCIEYVTSIKIAFALVFVSVVVLFRYFVLVVVLVEDEESLLWISAVSTMSNKAMIALEKFYVFLIKMVSLSDPPWGWPNVYYDYVVFVADIVWNNWSFVVYLLWCLSPTLLKIVSPTQQMNIRSVHEIWYYNRGLYKTSKQSNYI